jgi:hypothetical protein
VEASSWDAVEGEREEDGGGEDWPACCGLRALEDSDAHDALDEE